MKRYNAVKIIAAVASVVATLLWLLGMLLPDTFGFFNFSLALAVISGTGGMAILLRGLAAKKEGMLKKADVLLGGILLCVAGISLIFGIAAPKNFIFPVVGVAVAGTALCVTMIAENRKWDDGDNHKEGYKNYRERKEEEEKTSEEEKKD